jgi:hypothetical protein
VKRSEAWRSLAKKLLTEKRIQTGLCRELGNLRYACKVSLKVIREMEEQLHAHVNDYRPSGDVWGGYVYATYGTHHEERAMACLWMALEAEENGQ